MKTKTLAELAALLDWNAEPRPSPYQVDAWNALKGHPDRAAAVSTLREEMERQKAENGPSYFPYNYARKLERE